MIQTNSETVHVDVLDNGLTVLCEPMAEVSSAAATLLAPAGSVHDADDAAGTGAVLCEWLFRGAGERDTRALNDALDALGCQHHEAVHAEHLHLSFALLGRNLSEAWAVYADLLQRPRLEDGTFEPCRDLVRQDLATLADEPARLCGALIQERFYPHPLGHCVYGTAESLASLAARAVREHAYAHLTPRGAILAVAGNVRWPTLRDDVARHFGPWQGPAVEPAILSPPEGGVLHVPRDSAQTHLMTAHASATVDHPLYYPARLAEAVLSGGMSSRLFTEVREKRGLAYHVASQYQSVKGCAGSFVYAASVPAKAQQTFDVTRNELRRLGEGVSAEELDRAKIQLRSALVMQGESTGARAAALAGDWYFLGRVRSLTEVSEAVAAVTSEQIIEYARTFGPDEATVVVIGPEPVDAAAAMEVR